tara:strand:+ start:1706 stop:4354 length:2649 start_codon:yes stop_codon:yes gene_type:complete
MPGIECKITDSKLFSGSSDIFRTANGGYWQEVDVADGTAVEFKKTTEGAPDSPFFDRIFMSNNQEVVDKKTIMPARSVPIRVVSDGGSIKTDEEWKAVWYGGVYGPKTYSPIYTEEQFEYINFNYEKPYPQLAATLLTTTYDPAPIQISYDYRHYLKEYEDFQNRQVAMSELLLPNFYLMADLARWDLATSDQPLELYPVEMRDYLSRHNKILFNLDQFFDNDPAKLPTVPDWTLPQLEHLAVKNNKLSIEYLSSSYVQHPLLDTASDWATTKMKNMLFDASAVARVRAVADYSPPLHRKMPYNIKINFMTATSDTFTEAIVQNGYDSEFIKSIYQIFSGKSENLTAAAKDYNKASSYYSASIDSDRVDHVSKLETNTYREIDYLQMLLNSHNTYTDTDEDYMFVGPSNVQRAASQADSKAYRYAKTQPPLSTLNSLMEYLAIETTETEVTQWADLYSDTVKHTETVAYRVEKTGGPAGGDSNSQSALQNFWFMNSRPTPDTRPGDGLPFHFIDSQVKYGEDYTYKVYAYVLTVGTRYNFSDLVLSKQIGCVDDATGKVGLEFYDPQTGTRATRLLLDDVSTYDGSFSPLSGTFLTDANLFSAYPYAADFNLNYEPQIKIIEVPIYEKTLQILDNPVSEATISPSSVLGTQNQLGFSISQNPYVPRRYPSPVTDADATYKEKYLKANDLTDSLPLPNDSATNPVQVLVYRSPTRPQKIADMQYALHDTIDMRMSQQKYATYGGTIYYDKVAPNKKYYYLFKSLNEHDTQSHLSPVYEAQIVNDGGYSYAIFNLIMESELEEKIHTDPTKHFKNLLQLQPNLSQIQLNTEDADFSNSAASEKSNVSIGSASDLIWDKTFKIRLTSKKTGKKIDFNITYNLKSE